MKNEIPNDDMWELTARAVAGDISNDQFRRLIQFLEESEEARQQYVQAMCLQAQLSWLQSLESYDERSFGNELLSPTDSSVPWDEVALPFSPRDCHESPAKPTGASATPWLGFSSAAALLLTGVLIGMLMPSEVGDVADRPKIGERRVEEFPAKVMQVGELSASTNCSWLGSRGITPNISHKIISGEEFALLQGVAKLRLGDGVTLQIDGPAALVIASESSIVLQYGTLSGKIDSGNGSFEVAIPSGRLAVGEGEFGVRVAGEQSQVHCFAGSVAVTLNPFGSLPSDREFFESDILTEGKDVLHIEEGSAVDVVTASGILKLDRRYNADRNSFATTLPMEGLLIIPAAYVESVKASRPLGYWRFNPTAEQTVQNELGNKYTLTSNGHVRFGGDDLNTYIEFGDENTNGYMVSPEPIEELFQAESYSLEFWLKPSHYHHGMAAGLIDKPDTSPHGGVVIELQPGSYEPGLRSGRIRFLHRSPPSQLMSIGKSIYSKNQYSLRRWQHLVAVKDGAELRLYLDGKLVASGEEATRLAGELHAMCGQLPLMDGGGGRQYVGQLDEMALYDRPLTEQEIISHFRAAPQEPAEDFVASLPFAMEQNVFLVRGISSSIASPL
jgi:hypothetical protein